MDSNIPSITLINISWEDVIFKSILPYLNLQDLFSLRSVSTDFKYLVDKYFSTFKDLNLEHEPNDSKSNKVRISDCGIKAIGIETFKLKKLVLANNGVVQDSTLSLIFRNNPQLITVDLSGCRTLIGSCVLALAVNCKNIKTLKLQNCAWMSGGSLQTIIHHIRDLREIDFYGCSGLTNQDLYPFFQKFNRLQILTLASIHSVDDSTILALVRSLYPMSLKKLNIQGCYLITNNSIRLLAKHCHSLTSLAVNGCHQVTGFGLKALRNLGSVEIDRK